MLRAVLHDRKALIAAVALETVGVGAEGARSQVVCQDDLGIGDVLVDADPDGDYLLQQRLLLGTSCTPGTPRPPQLLLQGPHSILGNTGFLQGLPGESAWISVAIEGELTLGERGALQIRGARRR